MIEKIKKYFKGNYFEKVKDNMTKYDGEWFEPTQSSQGSAGIDFRTPIDFVVPAMGHSQIIYTNVKAYIRNNYFLMLCVRSSVGIKNGCVLSNNLGVIDKSFADNPDNDGNIAFRLYNTTNKDVLFSKGDRIIQGIFVKINIPSNYTSSDKRSGGIGSSGKS